MYRSRITKDFVEDKVSLHQILTRLKVISHELSNSELAKWTENEISGYSEATELLNYRKTVSYDFKYSGINNHAFNVENTRLDVSFISKVSLDKVSKIQFKEGIEYLEELAKKDEVCINRDSSFLANEIDKRTDSKLL